MKKFLAAILLATLLPAVPAEADVPGLQVNPLQYEDTLTTSTVKLGYIEVSNPSDTTISLESSVQGFRQKDNQGRLSFFDDPQISTGIKVDLPKFDLGSHEAIRVAFSVDPVKLPKGGVYAVIFFRTIPPTQSSASSFVSESANIGTLLLLQNGGPGVHVGQITHFSLPFWQFGGGISGTLDYHNTDRSATAVGFKPALSAQVFPWGAAPRLATGLVLPSSERQFALSRPGSYFGLLPVTLTDADSHQNRTQWIFAITGWYQLLLLIVIFGAIGIWVVSRFTKINKIAWARKLLTWLKRRLGRRRPAPSKRSMDTISRKPVSATTIEAMPMPEPEPAKEPELATDPAKPAPKTTPKPKRKSPAKTKPKPGR